MRAFGVWFFFVLLSGCSALHDGAGWEHTGDPVTHQDESPYVFEHRH